MEKIPTEINHVIKDLEMLLNGTWEPDDDSIQASIDMLEEAKIERLEFAKLHVAEALKYALEEVPYGGSDSINYEDVVGILTCYPLENIK